MIKQVRYYNKKKNALQKCKEINKKLSDNFDNVKYKLAHSLQLLGYYSDWADYFCLKVLGANYLNKTKFTY